MAFTLCLNDHIEEMDDKKLAKALSSIPVWRREKALAYKRAEGRMQSAVAYVELCRALSLTCGMHGQPRFLYNEHGKPSLADHPHVHFSMSHCKAAAGCVVSDCLCGFDVETIRPLKPALVDRTMNRDEAEQIFGAPYPQMAFAELWTKKEAVFKLFGTGITDSMHDILLRAKQEGVNIHSQCNAARGYVYSVAIQQNC